MASIMVSDFAPTATDEELNKIAEKRKEEEDDNDDDDVNLEISHPQQDALKEEDEEKADNEDGDEDEDEDEGGEGEGDHYEFSFVCGETNSPISADDIFQNGQIRPLFQFVVQDDESEHGNDCGCDCGPVGDVRSPIMKVFIERSDLPATPTRQPPVIGAEDGERVVADGPYRAWSEKEDADHPSRSAPPSSPDVCKKSNSTGFSRLFRFRDMLLRSYSDGKDAFVFLGSHKREDKHETTTVPSTQREKVPAKERRNSTGATTDGAGTSVAKPKVVTVAQGEAAAAAAEKKKKKETRTTSYAMQYGRKKGGGVGKEGETRRKSYLPYRQDLVGFFTNVNA
ncbi:hypothetical protein Dimus_015093 [Dionaea muscipula]